MLNKILDNWKTLEGPIFVITGLMIGMTVWALGLGRGFDQGFDQGIQTMETGQVQIRSTGNGFGQYFRLRSLMEGIPGVEAVSARIEFQARISNTRGESRTVSVRAFGFAQENKVTSFQKRVLHGISGPISGLLIPKSWEDQSFLFPSEKASLSSPDGTWSAGSVSVEGSLERTSVFLGPEAALLDLETAQAFLGPQGAVTSFVVRLDPGVNPEAWIKEQKDSFTGYGAELKSWKDSSQELRNRVVAQAMPLFIFRDIVVLAAFLVLLFLNWRYRGSSVWPLPKRPLSMTETLLVLASFLGVIVLSAWFLGALFPVWEGVFVDGFKADYPFTGPAILPWTWNWETVVVPLFMLGLGPLVFRRRLRR